MKTVYFVRHGEAEGNQQKIFKSPSAEITEEGRQHAASLAKRCLLLQAEALLVSPLIRAVQTAEYISDICGLEVEKSDYFTGVKYASSMIGKLKDGPEAHDYHQKLTELYLNDMNARYEDAESFSDISNRISQGLEFLAKRKEESIIVLSHQTMIKKICTFILKRGEFTVEDNFKCTQSFTALDHTGVSEFAYLNDKWKIVAWNDRAHFAE